MRKLTTVALSCLLATATNLTWANASCDAEVTAKQLRGAAKSSFLKKCEADARKQAAPACEAKAAEKKLSGAARTSFLKKCTRQ